MEEEERFFNMLDNCLEDIIKGNFRNLEVNIGYFEDNERYKSGIVKLVSLSKILNNLIEDSNNMNHAAKEGILDRQIDISKYNGDFKTVTKGINDTVSFTVEILRDLGDILNNLSKGEFDILKDTRYKGDYFVLKEALNNLIAILKNSKELEREVAYKTNAVTKLNEVLQGDNNIREVSSKSLNFIAGYVNAAVATIYYYDEYNDLLNLGATFALSKKDIPNSFALGEATVGQAALQKKEIILDNHLNIDLTIQTSYETLKPKAVYTYPLMYLGEMVGVVEFGSLSLFDEKTNSLIRDLNLILAASLSSAVANEKVKVLLQNSQEANILLEEQQQQLEETNSQLEEQQQQLEEQQQQLEEANSQMEEQQQQMEEANVELNQLSLKLKEKNDSLELSSKYKSEFLANMSHELRTPLNSIILLSELLEENHKNNLTEEDLKKTRIINSSGNELLRLINDILDLSKIESGKMKIFKKRFESKSILKEMKEQFGHLADTKEIEFILEDDFKNIIISDKDKILQVLRNLLSNAFKFTKEGYVKLKINKSIKEEFLNISVEDSGIGIGANQLDMIFNAFSQADGSISREYGGTGLGLSICKELVKMLNGEISVKSTKGKGSIFTFNIPFGKDNNKDVESVMEDTALNTKYLTPKNVKRIEIKDDRDNLKTLDKPFLIIEDDPVFARILLEKLHNQNQKGIIFEKAEPVLKYLEEYSTIQGIFLDLSLPDMDGIDLLKAIKSDMSLRRIPIYIISGKDKSEQFNKVKEGGALGYLQKPIHNSDFNKMLTNIIKFNEKVVKDLLVVQKNDQKRKELIDYIGNNTIKSTGVDSLEKARTELKTLKYDGIVIDITQGDQTAVELSKTIQQYDLDIPIIIFSEKKIDKKTEEKLGNYSKSIVFKSVHNKDNLLDKIDIFLHRAKVSVGGGVNDNIRNINLEGKKILVVDDDIRNIYVLSEALSARGADIVTAGNGAEAIEQLDKTDNIDIILMDIMMPVLNGYEAIKKIKASPKKNIPIIALTAKAMPSDKEKCLEAGADDYVSKPLNMDIFLGIIKAWLNKKRTK